MKIGINWTQETVALQTLDYVQSYLQHLERDRGYQACHEIVMPAAGDEDRQFLIAHIEGVRAVEPHKYHAVFVTNGSDPTNVADDACKQLINDHQNVYWIGNSFFHPDHVLHDRAVWYAHNINYCHDVWTRSFYPQWFDHHVKVNAPGQVRDRDIVVIAGANRAWRHHALLEIKKHLPEIDSLHDINEHNDVYESEQGLWESPQDVAFREWVNSQYPVKTEPMMPYRDTNFIYFGINRKFGYAPPAYVILDHYYQYRMVVVPESSCYNHELSISEKTLKCFFAGALPFPLAGSHVNQLYNRMGYFTAWNLLPQELQLFDSELDHRRRFQQAAEAVAWINDHAEVLQSQPAQVFIAQNMLRFLYGGPGTDVLKMHNILFG